MSNKEIKKAFFCEDKGLNFSALKVWQEIHAKEPTAFVKIRYANQLSVCGYFSKSIALFAKIDLRRVSKDLWYMKHQYLGTHFLRIGNIKSARSHYLKSLQYKNDSTVPYVFLAKSLVLENTHDESIRVLESALHKKGDIDEVCYNLARRLVIKGNCALALKYIEESLNIDPNYDLAQSFRNDLVYYISLENVEMTIVEAVEMANECEEKGMNFSAMRLLETVLLKQPTEYRKFLYANQLRLCGYFNKAEEAFLQVKLHKIPNNKRFIYYNYLSQLYYDKYNWNKAEHEIKKCFKYESTTTEVYLDYVKFLFKKEKHEEIILFLTKLIDKYEANSEIYYNMAVSALSLDKIELALEYVNLCIEKDISYPNAHTLKEDIIILRS